VAVFQRARFISCLVVLQFCCLSSYAQQAADTVVLHGKIYTENSAHPWAEAVAIRNGQIEAVGSSAEIEKYQGASTRVIDATGHLVLPGFVDSHVHFIGGADSLQQVDLNDVETLAEAQRLVKEFAASHPASKVIRGNGWVYPIFGAAALPDKKYLDEVVSDRPVILSAYDSHTYWANSKALEMAGVTRDTPNPTNGTIVRDPKTGEATGALKESAAFYVMEKLAEPTTDEEEIRNIVAGIKLYNSYGITRVHSVHGDSDRMDLFDEIRRRGQLSLRFYFGSLCEPPALSQEFLQKVERLRKTYHDEWITAGAIKFFSDGVIEANTAAMLAPYTNDPSSSGHLNWDPEKYKAAVLELDRRGFQIFTHAIGDRAIRMALDGYEQAREANHHADSRNRVEHIENPNPDDIVRFGKLGVIASMQPLHAYPNSDVLDVWARNVGPVREQNAWPWHQILASGGQLTFGSDWPVVTPDPWKGIQTLLTRKTVQGTPANGWTPQATITLQQAIHGYTLGAAYAGFFDKTEGSIETGKWADLIVLSQNLFDIPASEIHKTKVLYTLVGGRIVYQNSSLK